MTTLVSLNCSLGNAASLVLDSRGRTIPKAIEPEWTCPCVHAGSRHEQNQTYACHLETSLALLPQSLDWLIFMLLHRGVCHGPFSPSPGACALHSLPYCAFQQVPFSDGILKFPVSSLPSPEQVYWTSTVGLKEGGFTLTCRGV